MAFIIVVLKPNKKPGQCRACGLHTDRVYVCWVTAGRVIGPCPAAILFGFQIVQTAPNFAL
jgi:hypothetical protein